MGQTFFHFLNTHWLILSLFIVIGFSTFLTILWIHRTRLLRANPPQNLKQNLENIYNRIHNFQHDKSVKAGPSQHTHHSNASTDSSYHHAIKLLQRGIDTKELVEYCNLTYGEAELLQAVYGNKH